MLTQWCGMSPFKARVRIFNAIMGCSPTWHNSEVIYSLKKICLHRWTYSLLASNYSLERLLLPTRKRMKGIVTDAAAPFGLFPKCRKQEQWWQQGRRVHRGIWRVMCIKLSEGAEQQAAVFAQSLPRRTTKVVIPIWNYQIMLVVLLHLVAAIWLVVLNVLLMASNRWQCPTWLLHVMMLPADCCVIISCTYSNHFNCLMTSEKSSQTEVLLVAWIHVFEGKIVLLTGQRNKLFLKEIQKSNGPETLTIIDVPGTDRNRSTSIIDNAGFTQALEAIKSAAGSWKRCKQWGKRDLALGWKAIFSDVTSTDHTCS